ncbi:MAG: hypothetical protein WAU89_00245 [Candidatus Acidiferrales bacterium]
MPYRPRELAVRAREAATLLLNTLDHDEMVQRFLDIYAAENRRPGRADQPAHYREQLETIRREALLAMVLRTEAALPTRLKVHVTVRETKRRVKPKKGKKSGKRKRETRKRARKPGLDLAIPLLDLFREEFFVALGQALRWSNEDAQEFWHDLELYENLTAHEARRQQGRSGRAITSGPFVDRAALLLDPSLMEQARRAAGKFQMELNVAADRVLRRTFLRRRTN